MMVVLNTGYSVIYLQLLNFDIGQATGGII